MMSRRSQRLSHYYQVDDDGGSSSSSGGSSLTAGQHAAFKDSPIRTLKRKSSSVKRLSPSRLTGPAPSTQSTYYSESVVSETYIGRPRATPGARTRSSILNDEQLDSDSYWSGDPLVRRRRGTGGSESSKINGLTEGKVTYDTYGSSSGYSSEDDFTGHAVMDQLNSASTLRNAASQAGAFLWTVITFPGWLFGLLYWWLGTTWYRLTTAASLLDVFVLTRRFSSLKKLFLILLMLLLLASLAYGAWYFYPYGLQTFQPAMFSWWAAKGSSRREEVWESGDSTPYFQAEQHVLSKIHTLERRLETLASEYSTHWQKKVSLEHRELEQRAGGKGPSPDDTLTILEGRLSRQEAALKEDFRRDTAAYIQEELATLRAEHRQDLDNLLKRFTQASQEMESWVLQLKSEWQSLAQEALRENVLKEMGPLEAQLAGLKQELAALGQRQAAVEQQVDLWPQKMEALRDDVKSHLPAWIHQFLLQDKEALARLFQLEEVQAQLQELERRILVSVAEEQGRSAREAAANLKLTLRKEGMTGVTEEEVNQIVQQALKRYSEDRIGLVDYALESAGASIISTRCSETYDTKTAVLSLFGVPLWYLTQSPRAILQPDVYPGNCWAFEGPQGFAVIRLAARIRPTSVTLEHVSRTLSPSGDIPSAPREFAVLGLSKESESEGIVLGEFTYDKDGDPIQTFQLQKEKLRALFLATSPGAPGDIHSSPAGEGTVERRFHHPFCLLTIRREGRSVQRQSRRGCRQLPLGPARSLCFGPLPGKLASNRNRIGIG
ncbi:SUN domain-containing protein 2 isoform X2 [Sarcophilus harrisii]|uniref:SUN domain-containing protein 2 isoform X2 n=1 Tax=Sarcophilus harrisii TaxID=9305 RepID=UPI001301BC63|nr:SUN domain-containing protein 2 isoform X2 [Sarcophilus harrisii]